MPQVAFVLPPRMAVWLVDLFTPNEQNESILGDLLEEFSELTSKSGVAFARRWYWRQSVKTVAHLITTGFFGAPWLIAGNVVGGWLLWWAVYWITEKSVDAILHNYQVYAHGVYQALAVTAVHLATEKHTRIAIRRASIG